MLGGCGGGSNLATMRLAIVDISNGFSSWVGSGMVISSGNSPGTVFGQPAICARPDFAIVTNLLGFMVRHAGWPRALIAPDQCSAYHTYVWLDLATLFPPTVLPACAFFVFR